MRRIIRFLKETRAEMSKVVWPTPRRALKLTIVVIIVTIIFGAFIAAVDFGLGKGIQYIIDKPGKNNSGNSGQTVPAPGGQGQPVQVPANGGQPVEIPGGAAPGQQQPQDQSQQQPAQ